MSLKGIAAAAVALLAIWLMFGHHSTTPIHGPAVHVTSTAHHTAAPHAPTKKTKR